MYKGKYYTWTKEDKYITFYIYAYDWKDSLKKSVLLYRLLGYKWRPKLIENKMI